MSRKRTPDQEPPSEPTTATAEPPAAEARPDGPNFADRVGQKKRPSAADPYPIATDKLAGVRLFESKHDRQMALKFEEKPSQPVIDMLKEAGYRWNASDRIWAHPVRPESAMSTRIEAEAVYQEARHMIRQEKGIEPGPEMPF
jgi:Bacterial transcriptional activator domain